MKMKGPIKLIDATLKLMAVIYLDAPIKYTDCMKQPIYNYIPGQQDPKTGMICYFTPMKSGAYKLNRLIGDEHLPPENTYSKDGPIDKLPGWYIQNKPKPGARKLLRFGIIWNGIHPCWKADCWDL